MDKIDFVKLYETYFQFDFSGGGNQHKGTCPFCEKSGHFYLNTENGLFDCKRCGESGNHFVFLSKLHETYLQETSAEDCDDLCDKRPGITLDQIRAAKWAFDFNREVWLIPYFGPKCLTNLGYATTPEYRIYKAPGLKTGLFKVTRELPDGPLLVAEGEWDALAISDPSLAVVGVSGATSTPPEIKKLAKDREVWLLYDNDEAGTKGTAKMHAYLQSVSSRIRYLDWTRISDAKPKMDIRDLVVTLGHAEALSAIEGSLNDLDTVPDIERLSAGYTTDVSEITPVTSIEEYLSKLKEFLHITSVTEEAMIATLAVAASPQMDGEPLWLFLVGPPSCGKSTFIESFGGNNQYFDYASTLTAAALVSGWKAPEGDASQLPKINNKTFLVKDFTLLMSSSPDDQRKLFGLLRDVYDGTVKIPYGNGKVAVYNNIKFNMVVGVTDIIKRHNDSALGERFLRVDFIGENYDESEYINTALSHLGQTTERKESLTAATLGFIKHIKENYNWEETPGIPEDLLKRVTNLALFVSKLRTKPEHDRYDGLLYRPRGELATRLAIQLCKVLICITRVLGKQAPDMQAYHILRKVAFDTVSGFELEMVRFIAKHPGVDRFHLRDDLRLPMTRVQRVVNDLIVTGIVNASAESNGRGIGRNKHTYVIEPNILRALNASKSNWREATE